MTFWCCDGVNRCRKPLKIYDVEFKSLVEKYRLKKDKKEILQEQFDDIMKYTHDE